MQLGKTTVAAGYLLWTAMFMTDQKILISAHKYSGAKEIMDRVKFAYENCPMYLKAGCVKYNEKSIDFDNGSRIWAETTTANTGRGKSPSILYCLDGETSFISIRSLSHNLIKQISLKGLYDELTITSRNFKQNNDYEILTPSGWKHFDGIAYAGKKVTFTLVLENDQKISASAGHYFFTETKKVQVHDLNVGDSIDTADGLCKIIEKTQNPESDVYDIIEVDNESHSFYVNGGIVTKNSDELGFVKSSIEQDLWSSLTPAISRGGKLIITSTPNGDQNLFAKLWQGANNCIDEYGNPTNVGVNGFKAYKALWYEHPEQDEKWAQGMRQTVTEEIFKREFDCEFISAEETLISAQTLQNLKETEPISRQGQVRWFKPINKDAIYVVSLDPSLGTGSDPSAIQIIEANTTTQVGEWKHNKTSIQGQVKLMVEILFTLAEKLKDPMNQLYYSIENNTVGEAALVCIANYGEHNIPGIFLSETGKKRKGFNTTNKSKLTACSKLKHLIESGKLKIHSQALISELKNFVASGGSYAAKAGTTDDLVMSLLLAIRMIQQIGSYSSDLEKQMQDFDDIIPPLPIFMSFR
jgi:hypothetical protein